MTILAGRWDIDYVAKRVFRVVATSPSTTDTTLALYSALQDEFDEPAQMDDQVPMSAQTPTAFTMINQWFIDNVSTQFLTGGSLTTSGWAANEIGSKSYDNTGVGVAFVAADIGRTITGDTTTDTGVILDFDERFGLELGVVYIRPTVPATDTFDNDTEPFTVSGGTGDGIFSATYQAGVLRTGESLWPNIFALGTLVDFTQLYVIQNEVKIIDTAVGGLAEWWPEGFFDVLIRTTEQGTEIDDGELMVGGRQQGALFDHFVIDVSAGGRQPIPLSTGADLNNPDGTFNNVFTDSAGAFVVGELATSASNGKRLLITAVSGTNPTITIEYVDIGTAATPELEAGDGVVTGAGGGTGTAVASVAVNQNALAGFTPTLVVANTDASLGAGEPVAPYSLQWDTNQAPFSDVYGYWKLVTRRGEGTGAPIDTDFTAQAGGQTITGEQYIGSTLQAEWNTQTGTFVEGDKVAFFTSGDVLVAQGVIVADHDDTGTGDMIVRNSRTLAAGTIGKVTDSDPPVVDTGNFAVIASTRGIAPVKVSPFGTLAGGVIFGAPGVLLTDILAAEAQNFQLIDDDGNVRTPPITVTVTVTGTLSDDRVGVYVLDNPLASNGVIVKTQLTLTAAAATENGIGDSNLEADATIPNDQPAAGQVIVVDDSATDGREDQFQYDSFTGQIFTLTPITLTGAQLADTQDLTGTLLIDADAAFIANGVKVGHIVRNVTDANGFGVATIVAAAQVTMTPLTGGTGDTWEIGDAYEINTIPVDYTTSDTAYVPLILDETGGTSIVSGNMTFIGNRDLVLRVRNGGSVNPILPFETGAQIGNTNLSVAAIRTTDSIAT